MRRFLLPFAIFVLSTIARGESFEIQDADRVLFLGDTLLEREGNYGYLETRMGTPHFVFALLFITGMHRFQNRFPPSTRLSEHAKKVNS